MRISCYILTYNSQRRLREALESLHGIADEILVIDSGSTDETLAIAREHQAKCISRTFDDFTSQRNFALSACQYPWVLTIDSDEVLSSALQEALRGKKKKGTGSESNGPDAFAICRVWIVLGRTVRCFYPSLCPDAPVRLFLKNNASYIAGRRVHETLRGFQRAEHISEPILHYSCDSIEDLYGKMGLYTTLAARDVIAQHGYPSYIRALLMPWIVAFRWYFLLGGWRDGVVGVILARYVLDTVYLKYQKARWDNQPPN